MTRAVEKADQTPMAVVLGWIVETEKGDRTTRNSTRRIGADGSASADDEADDGGAERAGMH